MATRDLVIDFLSPCGEYCLTFEDDGKVAYAYLKFGDSIVGDVWLYNRCVTPTEPEWKDPSNIPFANPRGYVTDEAEVAVLIGSEDINVDWEYEDGKAVAYVYVFEDLYGVIGLDDKPGYARFAAKDGPLARVMVIE